MPRGDGTGPNQGGSMSGRGLGFCTGYKEPGFVKSPGMGFGRGGQNGFGRARRFNHAHNMRGFGRGMGFYSGNMEYNPETEKAYLENTVNVLKREIESVQSRLDELNKTSEVNE